MTGGKAAVVEVLLEDYADLLRDRKGREILARALEAVEWGGGESAFGFCPACEGCPDDESPTGGHDDDCTLYVALVRSGWRKRACSICRGDVPAEAQHPLCTSCEGTARAGGKLAAEEARHAAEVVR